MSTHVSDSEEKEWLELCKAIVARHLGSSQADITRQSEGLSNFVYAVKHQKGSFVVRLAPQKHKLEVFRREQFATEKARAAGVPTAEVLYVGDEAVPHPYMIQTLVRGQPALHHPERMKVLEQVGRYGALINSIATDGFGRNFPGAPITPPAHASWAVFLRDELDLEQRLSTLLRHGMMDAEQVGRVRAVLETAGEGSAHGQLNHGDLRLKNVLVDEQGTITAIIDWEHCLSALAPHWEWSIALHDLSIDAMEAFLVGYGASPQRLEAVAPVIKALNIVNYVPSIERLIRRGEQQRLEWIRARLSGALDLYSM